MRKVQPLQRLLSKDSSNSEVEAKAIDMLPSDPFDSHQGSLFFLLAQAKKISGLSNSIRMTLSEDLIQTGCIKISEAIIEYLKVTWHKQRNNCSLLSWAARNGMTAVVRSLLTDPDVDPNRKDNITGCTPLSYAVECGRLRIVSDLLALKSIDPNTQDRRGQTPLLKAAKRGETGVVRLLLAKQQINVNVNDDEGHTALYWARRNRHLTIVRLLLARRDIIVGSDTSPASLCTEYLNGHRALDWPEWESRDMSV